MKLLGFNSDGTPQWRPPESLQRQIAFERIDQATSADERAIAVEKWLSEALFELEFGLQSYRKYIRERMGPKGLFRRVPEDAAFWQGQLETLGLVDAWWREQFEEIARSKLQ
jgi:hypothetical protein